MARYNIAQAKARLSELVDKAVAGEEVIIARHHKPLLRLVPYQDRIKRSRKPGSAKGQIRMSDDFDKPLRDFKRFM